MCLFLLNWYYVFIFNCQMAVNSRIISGNLDSPEGGIDGLLQAVVCQDVSHHAHTYTHTHTTPHTCTHAHTHTHTCLHASLAHAGATLFLQIIGWRENPARRLLVYMTDASFHFGADGKVAGMVIETIRLLFVCVTADCNLLFGIIAA